MSLIFHAELLDRKSQNKETSLLRARDHALISNRPLRLRWSRAHVDPDKLSTQDGGVLLTESGFGYSAAITRIKPAVTTTM